MEEELPLRVLKVAIPDMYVEHGNVDKLKEVLKIDAQSVFEKIQKEVV